MQIIEVKNNLVRINYEPNQDPLILSGFVTIKNEVDSENPSAQTTSFIAQVMHLESNAKSTFAILKLLFNFDAEGTITNYNGSIPSLTGFIRMVNSQDLLGLLPVQTPIVIGELAQQNTMLKLDENFLKEKLLICSERAEDNRLLTENINAQLTNSGKKVVIVDLSGELDVSQNKIVASENFKFPLNYETINFIYEKGLDDANAETKALIQDVFLEVQEYVKTLDEKFIPFNLFKNVVDEQYQELGIVELVLLKNKLLKYYEAGLFAQEKSEFDSLELSLQQPETTIFDLSQIEENFQREAISYLYSLISRQENESFVLVNVNNSNSNKKLLKQIFTTKNAYSTVICPYSYKYLTELKQLTKNLILFAPIQQQTDFASYNTFLNKLNPDEFIVYGNATHHLSLIVKLDDSPQKLFENPSVEEEIIKDVDQLYSPQKADETEEIEEEDEFLTEDDLDFVEQLNVANTEEPTTEETAVEEEFFEEEIVEEAEVFEEVIEEPAGPPSPFLKVVNEVTKDLQRETDEGAEIVPQQPRTIDILPARETSTPIVPIYSADVEPREGSSQEDFEQGDTVTHPKYGKGTVEKLINYGSKTLCSINFDNVGRRLLDPALAEIKKI